MFSHPLPAHLNRREAKQLSGLASGQKYKKKLPREPLAAFIPNPLGKHPLGEVLIPPTPREIDNCLIHKKSSTCCWRQQFSRNTLGGLRPRRCASTVRGAFEHSLGPTCDLKSTPRRGSILGNTLTAFQRRWFTQPGAWLPGPLTSKLPIVPASKINPIAPKMEVPGKNRPVTIDGLFGASAPKGGTI